MTQYGWDTSDYDWARGVMNINAARQAGVALITGKVTEGTDFHAVHFDDTMNRAVGAAVPVLGAYHVLYPSNMANVGGQVDWYLRMLNQDFHSWQTHGCFIHQIDAEKFSYMTRAPNLAEIHQFADTLAGRGIDKSKIVVYAPEWLYGNTLAGLRYKLWASKYVSRTGNFKTIYPGDDDVRWNAYSGLTPAILQYSSSATIGTQPTCDANAIRVSSEAALVAMFHGDGDDMTPEENATLNHIQDLVQDIINKNSPAGNIYLGTLEAHLTAVSANVNAMATNVNDIEAATNLLKTQNAALATQNAALAAQVTALQTAVDALEPGTGGTAPNYSATFEMTPVTP